MTILTHLGYVSSILLDDPMDRSKLTFHINFTDGHGSQLDSDMCSALCVLLSRYNISFTVDP